MFSLLRGGGYSPGGGKSSRYGEPKQLSTGGEPLVRQVHGQRKAGLSPVLVVTGAHAGPGGGAGRPGSADRSQPGLGAGQSTSLRAGLSALPGDRRGDLSG
jgi:CTP:molybdopterin cytidylyltransferase MocA